MIIKNTLAGLLSASSKADVKQQLVNKIEKDNVKAG